MDPIEKIIEDNVTYLTTVPAFRLGYPQEFNKLLDDFDNPEIPVCLLDHFINQSITYGESGNLLIISDLEILLLQGYPEDNAPELFEAPTIDQRRNQLVNAMRVSAYELISALDQDSRLDSQKQYRVNAVVRAVYNLFDSNLDGVSISIKLRQQRGRIQCGTHSAAKPGVFGVQGFVAMGYVEPDYVA